jgi:two-component system, cell cycle response regulator
MGQLVLAIDDSPDVHRLLEVRLRPEGLVLHHALTADEGLAKAIALKPDLILLDVHLPLLSGFEVCHRLKNDPVTAGIPIIFLTGASAVQTKVQAFDLGAVDYVVKPFEPAELRARVRAALRTKRFLDLLAARSHVDGLTGVWNRTYFDQRFGDEIAAAKRYGRVVSLVMLDLDHFKGHNDSFGHPFGDQVLQAVGDILHAVLRSTDAPCRFGGEEFALILTETDEDGAQITAERVRRQIEQCEFRPRDRQIYVTASLGLAASAMFDSRSLDTSNMITAADDALYRAKHEGRNRVYVAKGTALAPPVPAAH